jgi:hypothetical protein
MAMKTNGRCEERLLSNLTTNVRYQGNAYSGEARNISKYVLYIEAINISIEKNRDIQILLAAEKDLFTLSGEIIWNRALPCKSSENTLRGIGIRITEAPPEYLNYVEYLKHINRFNN